MKLFNKSETKKLPEPELKRIPIDNLVFPPYQRELKMSKVNKIVNKNGWIKYGVIIVN